MVCGFFGDGPAGYNDVECAIEEAETPCVYTKPTGPILRLHLSSKGASRRHCRQRLS